MKQAVLDIRESEISRSDSQNLDAAAQILCGHFGAGVAAILFYGGGLRKRAPDAVLDFYVLVDTLRAALPHPIARLGAYVLPPNVYAFQVPQQDGTQTCKVAVMATRAFERGMTAFTSHLWARFAQPVTLVYVRDATARTGVTQALSIAATTAVRRVAPLMPPTFTATELWRRIFEETYAAELRPESRERAAELIAAAEQHYAAVTAAALGSPDAAGLFRRPHDASPGLARVSWAVCRPWGKLINALRLMKAAFTYAGGLDYAVAKIARHSGVTVTVTDADRRRPLLGGIRIFLEARRRGGVR